MQIIVNSWKDSQETIRSIKRHMFSIIRRVTFKRLLNLLLVFYEAKNKLTVLKSHPVYMRINPCAVCNLNCPGCEVGIAGPAVEIKKVKQPGSRMMNFETFKKCIEPLKEYLFQISLYDEGEPLLNPELELMIAYVRKLNISSCVSSNLSLRLTEQKITNIISSGLDHLVVAIDGTTHEIYEKYRKGGSLELVLSNIKRFVEIKNKLKNKNLLIDMQFIIFDHNKHQIEDVKLLAKQLGVGRLTMFPSYTCRQEEIKFKGGFQERKKLGCYCLWLMADITADGKLYPCDYGEDNLMPPVGFVINEEFMALWNHPLMRQARASFHKNSQSPFSDICIHCPKHFGMIPALR